MGSYLNQSPILPALANSLPTSDHLHSIRAPIQAYRR